MVQLLAVYGSPRPKGNSDVMMDYFLKGAVEKGAEVKSIFIRKLRIGGCVGCGHCDREGFCIQKDDMKDIYPLLLDIPLIVIASPNYFYNLPGQLKCFVDRSQALFMARKKGFISLGAPKKGYFLGVGGTKGKKLFECSIITIKYFFDAIGATFDGNLCFRAIDEKGEIYNHPDYLEQCYDEGKKFVLRGL